MPTFSAIYSSWNCFIIYEYFLDNQPAPSYIPHVPSTARGATSRGVRRVGRDAVPVCVARYVDARPRTAGGRRVNRPVRPRSGPAAVNAKAERCRVARQGDADVSAQGCVRPLARGRPVTPGPPRRNPWHGALGAPPPRIGGGGKEEDYGPTPAPAPSLGTYRCVCWAV